MFGRSISKLQLEPSNGFRGLADMTVTSDLKVNWMRSDSFSEKHFHVMQYLYYARNI